MITEDRIRHMLSVARKCYSLAKETYNLSEDDARTCFVMGLLHDIGYEFCEKNSEHPEVGYNMLEHLTNNTYLCNRINNIIKNHGNINVKHNSILDKILNTADLSVDAKGNFVSVEERIKDIGNRYGFNSSNYLDAKKMAEMIGLL